MAKGRDAGALMNREVLRFLVAGTAAAGINWAAGMALARAMPFEAAIVLAYLIGMASGFTLNKLFVFPPTDRPLLAQVQGFAAVNLGGIVLVWVVAVALRRWIMPDMLFGLVPGGPIAHGLAIGVSCVTSYVGHRRVTFRPAEAV
jgi:energy-coupling factor transport system substrate-specific component